jgi:hypothetical protein
MAEDFGYTYSGDPSKQVTTAYKSSIVPQYDSRGRQTNLGNIDPYVGTESYTNPLTGEITTGISELYKNKLANQGNKSYQDAIANNDPRVWQGTLDQTPWDPTKNASYNQLFGDKGFNPYSDFDNSTPDFSSLVTSFDLPSWITQGQQSFNPYTQPFTSQFTQDQGQEAEQYQPPPTYTHEDLMKGYQDFYNPPAPTQTQAQASAPQQQNFGYNALNPEAQSAHSQLMQQYQNQAPAPTTPAAPAAPATTTPAP